MNLKKFAGILSSLVLTGALFTGCGGDSGQDVSDTGKTVRLGMIAHLNASEQKLEEILKQVAQKADVKIPGYTVTYFKNLSSMQMGLESGSIDQMSTYQSVADYLTARKPEYVPASNFVMKLSDSFCFAVKKDDEELRKSIDNVIDEMKKDGTLDQLVKEYITDLKKDSEPPAVSIQKFDGAETIKIAVTGDLPPLDLVLPDGKPAGFNTALLAEIGKRLQRNIEIVHVDSDSRAASLASGAADVVFWAILPIDERPADMDTPEGISLTEPYFSDKIVHLSLKK